MARIDPDATVQELDISDDDLKLQTPFTMCVAGPSMSGKSEFILKLITNRKLLFAVNFERIIYCEPEHLVLRHNPIFERLKENFPNAELNIGLPDVNKLHLTIDTHPVLLWSHCV